MLIAYGLTEYTPKGSHDKKTKWTPCGSAFKKYDGSINITLDCIPLSGRLQIRRKRERDDQGGGR